MTDNQISDPFVVSPTSEHTHTAILLHGLGSNGMTFGKELLHSGVTSSGKRLTNIFPGMKFIFPTARKRRSAAFKRATLNQWFNIASLDQPSLRRELQIDGLTESAADIWLILKEEIDRVGARKIILGGLSQGCAMSIFVLLSLEFPIGAYVGLSGWLPFYEDIMEFVSYTGSNSGGGSDEMIVFGEDSDDGDVKSDQQSESPATRATSFVRDVLSMSNTDTQYQAQNYDKSSPLTPVFLGHGAKDLQVKCSLGEKAAKTLKSMSMDIRWRCYPELGHWYEIPDEIDDVVEFLMENLDEPVLKVEGA